MGYLSGGLSKYIGLRYPQLKRALPQTQQVVNGKLNTSSHNRSVLEHLTQLCADWLHQ